MGSVGNRIAILTHKHSVVVRGIEAKLKSLRYEVTVLENKFDSIGDYLKINDLFMIYLPDDILDNVSQLDTVRNVARIIRDADCKMTILGDSKNYKDCNREIPEIEGYTWINRPVDMNKLGDVVSLEISSEAADRKRILIVDDDPYYAETVKAWISDAYDVDIAPAGMSAISFLLRLHEKKKVDLILLDYEMPVVDGPQVLQMLRQENELKDIPVIFLTGNGSREAVTRVMALKPNGYLLKAVKREELLIFLHDKLAHKVVK